MTQPPPPVSQEYLDTLEQLQEAPNTRTVYLLGIPTARVPDPDHIVAYKTRNRVRIQRACTVLTLANDARQRPRPYSTTVQQIWSAS